MYKIIKDKKYGYARISPLPSEKEVEEYYKKEFYAKYGSFNDSELKVQKEEKKFFDSRWEDIKRRCIDYFGSIKGRSLFDVGCGYSQALLYFKKNGLAVSGLEPSTEGATYAKKIGLDVYQSRIEDFSCIYGKRFDIVLMINVLEHLRNAAEILIQLRKDVLKKKGILVIDVANEYNDFQVVADKEYKLKSWWFCPPNHINYFSHSSLCKTLELCGYKVVVSEASFPIELFLLLGDIYVGNPTLGKICHEKRVRFEYLMKKHGKGRKLQVFYEALAKLDLGRQIVVYATPR
ncbi:MAG: class I SAM-dependent methyltransferase [Candidatus Omnitrophica bacterium]|nr:class I SAM-dependent methyltransferase [Candidatus Omnitrophota bacterium]